MKRDIFFLSASLQFSYILILAQKIKKKKDCLKAGLHEAGEGWLGSLAEEAGVGPEPPWQSGPARHVGALAHPPTVFL